MQILFFFAVLCNFCKIFIFFSEKEKDSKKAKKILLPSALDALADQEDSVDFLKLDERKNDRTLSILEKKREKKINGMKFFY